MNEAMRIRAIKLLLRQTLSDRSKGKKPYFTDAWVVGRRLFLTKEAVDGWPNKKRLLVERVQLEDALDYEKKHPELSAEIGKE